MHFLLNYINFVSQCHSVLTMMKYFYTLWSSDAVIALQFINPLLCHYFWHYIGQKSHFSVCQKCSVTHKMSKMRFRPGFRSLARCGAYDAPADLVGCGSWHPCLDPTPDSCSLRRFDSPLFASSRPSCLPHPSLVALRCFRAGYGPEPVTADMTIPPRPWPEYSSPFT